MFISITLLKLSNPLKLIEFIKLSKNSIIQAQKAPGNLHTSTRGSLRLAFYTLTAWETNKHMRDYIRTGAHKEAMKHTAQLAKHIESSHFENETVPSWDEAIARLNKDPKRDKSSNYLIRG